MAIRHVAIQNFKSFRSINVDLAPFSVLVGANASGKTNFISVFSFVRDISRLGLDNAISIQGGTEFLKNKHLPSDYPLVIDVAADFDATIPVNREGQKSLALAHIHRLRYAITIEFTISDEPWAVTEEQFVFDLLLLPNADELDRPPTPGEYDTYESGVIRIERDFRTASMTGDLPEGYSFERWYWSEVLEERIEIQPQQSLLSEANFFFPFPGTLTFSDISVFDFDPKLPKQPVRITGKQDLEEDGRNLAITIRNILAHPEQREKFLNLFTDVLPFISKVRTSQLEDTSVIFRLRERFKDEMDFPSYFASDGTINIAALIVALHFDSSPLTIIEEPERNIHPKLISRVINIARDAASSKQVLLTTHNPEVVRHTKLGELLLAKRDKEGFSTVTRPETDKRLKLFLEGELGVEDLFVQGLLE